MEISELTDEKFLELLESQGFALRPSVGKLRCVVPGGEGLDETLRPEIARRRDALLAIVSGRPIPLSFEQERLWFLDEYGGESASAYHMPAAFRIAGALDTSALKKALDMLVERHESLRTVFGSEHGEPYQEIQPPWQVALTEEPIEASTLDGALIAEAMKPFDLARGPLTRFRLLRLGEDDHVLVVCQHHIIGDGWSTGILLDEIGRSYSDLVSGLEPDLSPPALQYADYALWQRTGRRAEKARGGEDYWREKLNGLEELELLPDFKRPPVRTTAGKRVAFDIDGETARRVREIASAEGCTPFMVLLTAFGALLQRFCGHDDIAVGTPVANRGSGDLEGTVGFFVNTLVLRTGLGGDPTFREALTRVKRTCLDAYEHQDVPFGRLVDLMEAGRDPSRSPLFNIMFVLRHLDGEESLDLPGCTATVMPVTYDTAKFDMALELNESPGKLTGEIEYNSDLYTAQTAGRVAASFEKVLRECCRDPQSRPADVEIMDGAEKEEILSGFNATGAPFPASTLHALFRKQARRTPESIALVSGDEKMTYGELDRASDAAAARLVSTLGDSPTDAIVGLPATPEPGTIVCMLGILKAGCAYLPLDPGLPTDRLAFMLEDSGARALLASGPVPGNLAEAVSVPRSRGRAVPVVEADGEPAGTVPGEDGDPRTLAYLIYTSGSTGEPKGVLVEHLGVSNLVVAQREVFGIDSSSKVLQFAPLGFDASVSEMFTALLTGAELHLASSGVRQDAERLVELIDKSAITTATLPPALLAVLPHKRMPALETLVVAGDRCDEETMRRWSAGRRLVNAYGPTEATVCASMHVWRDGDSPSNTGRPMHNVRLYVLDARMRPVPVGVPGSLFIGGAGLARGYLNRPELDEESFVRDPFPPVGASGAPRLYKTGDRARWLAGGELEFLGRSDDQVKIRGFRVEPGEIESALRRHPAVVECIVAPVQEAGTIRLAAYWVPSERSEGIGTSELREFLGSKLPAYMVPSWFIPMDTLPVTSSGKVDRKALPAFDARAVVGAGEGGSPGTPTEKKLAAIWEQVLKVERIDLEDNFFSLGGDSIMSIQVVSRAREAGLEIEPRDLFNFPTVATLAARADRASRSRPRTRRAKGEAPLTPIQSWFFDLDMPDMNHFNQSVLLKLDQEVDPDVLREALKRLARRHDSLLLRFEKDANGRWRQSYSRAAAALDIRVREIDLSGRPDDLGLECEKLQASMDITAGPVAVAAVFTGLPDSRQRMLLAVHHLVVDAVSWPVLLEDLAHIYMRLREGKPVRFTSRRGSSYQEWGEALRRYRDEKAGAQLDYWLDVVNSAQHVQWEMEGGAARSGDLTRHRVTLDPERTSDLVSRAAAAYHAGARDLLVAALLHAWSKVFGEQGLLLDLEGHGRESMGEDVDVTRTVGWFTSLYPVLLRVPSGAPDDAGAFSGALIKTVKEELHAVPDGGLGYGVLKYMGRGPGALELRERPGAGVAFNYLGRMDVELPGKLAGEIDTETDTGETSDLNPAAHPLEINARISNGRFEAEFAASTKHLSAETARRLADTFEESLIALMEHCLEPGAGGYTPSDFPLVSLGRRPLDAIVRGEETDDIYYLSPMQEGLLFHALYAPGSDQYLEQLCWKYTGRLDTAALKKAWEQIVSRHAIFRTAFFHEGLERPVQVVRKNVAFDWRESDWREVPPSAIAGKMEEYIRDDRSEGFDLGDAGLIRFHLIRTGEEEHEFIWCFHHILIDGWCSSVLLDELRSRYQALTGGRPFKLPAPPPFREFLAWLGQRDAAADDEFWRGRLEGADEPTPLGMNRRSLEIHKPIEQVDEATVRLTEMMSAKVGAFARENRVTVNSVLQTAWAMVLGLYSDREDVVLGVNVSGRPGEIAGVEKMVGLLVNAVPVRCRLDAGGSALDAVLSMHEEMQAVNEHCYGSLAEVQLFSKVPSGTPLFFSEYVFENYPVDESILEGMPGLTISDFRAVEKTNYPLGLMAAPGPALSVKALYDVGSFSRESIERMLGHIRTAVEWIVENSSSPLKEASLMPPEERETVVRRWSGAEVPVPRAAGPSVAELFRERASNEPGRPAIRCEGERLTYGELLGLSETIAGELASLLPERDAPDRAVGLFVSRSPRAVAAMIGINTAGSAFVAMDPEHPDERIRFIVEDAGMDAILTEEIYLPRLRELVADTERTRLISLENIGGAAGGETARASQPDDTACVIYTSGSTGIPKGVAITNRNLSDHMPAAADCLGLTEDDVVLQFSTLAFDASLEQIFTALLTGAELVMRGDALWTPTELRDVVLREGVTVMNLPTGYWRETARGWAEDPGDLARSRLRLAFPGGDVMDADTVEVWRGLPLPPHRLLNMYGPTETTITATICEVPELLDGPVPIGRPVGARRLYVLGKDGRLKPPGIPGELFIGGTGVSPGYLGRPEETAARFLEDPFATDEEMALGFGRMYKTGDLVRWRENGELEFLGRADFQTKLRGFRVEPEEIEAVLGSFPGISEGAVVAVGEGNEKELVAYYVPGTDSEEASAASAKAVSDWEQVYEELFGRPAAGDFDTTGWDSSYDGLPIPPEQMHEWVDWTVARIVELGPRSVVEIGCGTGLILTRVAPHCRSYLGIDFSQQAIDRLTQRLAREPIDRTKVLQGRAEDTGRLVAGAGIEPDTIVLNSVAQYFPRLEYLEDVLEQALEAVGDGTIFIGDVRDLRLQDAFHLSVEIAKAGGVPDGDLRSVLARDALNEKELLVSPWYFMRFAEEHGRVTDVRIMAKQGRFSNEMNDYRYDVVLKTDGGATAGADERAWEPGLDLARLLSVADGPVTVHGYPNTKTWTSYGLSLLAEKGTDLGDLAGALENEAASFLSLEQLESLATDHGYTFYPRLALVGENAPASYDLVFSREGAPAGKTVEVPAAKTVFANTPLARAMRTRIDVEALRDFLSARLPGYMVPARFVELDAVPGAPTGKPDRRALEEFKGAGIASLVYASPRDEYEALLADIFADVLGLDRVGVDDDFFRLGGHSLSATRVASRIGRVFGMQCPVKSIFEHPTVSELAAFIRAGLSPAARVIPPLVRSGRTGRRPLSFAQERLWFLDRFEPVSDTSYNMPSAFRLTGPLDVAALARSFKLLFERHESLRTAFADEGGEPFQVIGPSSFELEVEDVTADRSGARIDSLVHLPFDLETGPLARVHLLRVDEEDHVLLINQHHIVSDAWSVGVLFEELSECYAAYAAGREPELEEVPVSYGDFAIWQKGWLTGDVLRDELEHWRGKLEGAKRLELPAARSRGERAARRGKQFSFRLDQEVTARLKRTSREAGASLYMLLLGVFSLLLARTCGEDDVLLGTVTAGRTEEALEKVLGFFVNTVLLRIDLSGDPTFAELLERVRETALDAFAHQDLPFEKLVAELRPERVQGTTPLFSAMLVYQNVPAADLELEGLGVNPTGLELGAVRSDLDLYAWEEGGALELCLVYDADLFEEQTIATMAARLQRIAALVSKDAMTSLSAVSYIEPAAVAGPAVPSPLPAGKTPLSFHQERLWFIDRFEEGTVYDSKPVYHNMPLFIAFDGPVDERLLEASLAKVVERHAALRTRVETTGNGAEQSVGPAAGISLESVGVEGGGEARLKEAALAFAGRPFTDEKEPRVRAALISGESGSLFVIAVHHILADSRSLETIAEEVCDFYGVPSGSAADEKLPYPAFGEWQRNVPDSDWEPLLYDWKWRMRGEIPALTLPENRPRPAIHTYTAGVHDFTVGRELAARLEDLARNEQTDVESVLLSGFMLTLLCFSGQDELVVGMFGDGRPRGAEKEVGPFDNLLPIRGRTPPGLTCRGFIKRVQETVAEARANGALPFDLLVEKLNPPVDMSRTALFDVLFGFREGRRDLMFGETRAHVIENNLGLGKYDLNLVLTADEGDIDGIATFNADIYDKASIAGMMSRYLTVLENMVSSPDSILGDFSLLSEEEEELSDCWNETAAHFPETATLDGLFAEQARKTPDRVAVTFEDRDVTYSELDAEANRLAHYLKELGVGRDDLVALCLDRSVESVTAMLAVLKAGGAYLPIEASFPPERIAFVLEDSGADVMVTTSETLEKLPGRPPGVVLLDADAEMIASLPDDAPPASATPADLAYCIYTSGSTGRPKGVLVEHRNVVRLLVNDRMPFDFSQEDVWTMFHSYAFDFSVWEMYGALLSGGRLVIVPSETTRDSSLLLDLIDKEGVTVLNQVPSAFYSLSREAVESGSTDTSLRYVIFGGEALDYSMLHEWRERFGGVRLVNMYGITETCVHVTFKEVRDEDIAVGIGNIGRPLPDTTVTIVDGLMRPLPPGIAGEICVGGGGVARGYLGRDDLSTAKFVPDPRRPSGRLYRSGDLGRFLPDGEIEYLGRIDDQVQVRGFRVEPGEIENRLAGHPGVERAAVRVWERKSEGAGASGQDLFFAAYYRLSLAGGAGPQPGPEELKAFLAETLPSYMVPSYVVPMDKMPLTPGGKVDRKSLPDPRTAGRTGTRMLGPRDPVELRLKEIWEEVIGATVSIRDDFFLAGGHSLLAVRLVSRINSAFATSHAVSWAFLNRTVEEQARALREEGRSAVFRPLVTFNGKGDRTPVFFVHPGQAGAEAYSSLASLLGDDIPFHAVESRNLFDLERPMLAMVQGLAESYMEAILPVCGRGPCILGGWSFGGTVAFEIARRMLEQGTEVEKLVLLDAIRYDEEERELMRELARAGEADALLQRETLYRDFPETYRDRLVEVMRLEFEAMAAYGSGEYPGRVLLLKPTEEQPAAPVDGAAAAVIGELSARLAPKADNGWSVDIADLEVRQVPGDHLTMMEGRGLKEIARILSGLRSQTQGQ